ncbi:MAG TPA: hypothetical protein EYN67_08420 [Flavobacteriales bacterium]|nr:hypothetical protein [Methylococcaceae bacterium]HHZ95568.1 hypothetical protein [Flavobacteriales bacterium]
MADPRQASTRRAALGYDQLKRMTKESGNEWPTLLIKDYQGILQDFIFLANDADEIDEKITQNTSDISTNADGIQLNADNFDDHNTSNSQHGVTGDNVGTEDFCTVLVGGVVLLMALVDDAVDSTQTIALTDLAAAPATYDQAYTQLATDLANDTKAKHNQLVLDLNSAIAQINDLIAKAKTAKQMVV